MNTISQSLDKLEKMKPTPTRFQQWDEIKKAFIGVYALPIVCPYYIFQGTLAFRAAALNSILVDLKECHDNLIFLRENIERIPAPINKSLLFYSIILYIKCYNSNEGRRIRLDHKVFRGKETLKDFHDKTWDLRDSYLAHAGMSDHESRHMVAVLNPDPSDKKILETQYSSLRFSNDNSNLDNYIAIVEASMDYTMNALDSLEPGFQEEVLALDLDQIYDESVTPTPDKMVQIPM